MSLVETKKVSRVNMELNEQFPFNNVELLGNAYSCELDKLPWKITTCKCEVLKTAPSVRTSLKRYGRLYCKEHDPLKGRPRKSRSSYEYESKCVLQERREQNVLESAINNPQSHLYR